MSERKRQKSFFTYIRLYCWEIVGIASCGLIILLSLSSYYRQVDFTIVEILPSPPMDALYRNHTASPKERAEDLLSRMTLEEKIGQMVLVEKNSIHDLGHVSEYGIGALLSGAGAKPDDNTAQGWMNMVQKFTNASRGGRLGIPILYGVDAIHGHTNVPGATVFPHALGLGATGNAELVHDVARAVREEMLATGINWNYAPNLDLPEDVRWGRTFETFGDDPILVTKMGEAFVEGFQGENTSSNSKQALSTLKHYIGVGSMKWGSSSNKNFRIDQGMTKADEKKLRNIYLLPFKAGVDAGVGSVMVGLNSWNETKLAAEKYLVTDVLKVELDFNGFVVSDWYGVYEIPGGEYQASVLAINAGIDMVMLPFDYTTFIKNVKNAVRSGDIPESRIDDAVRRILTAKFELGLFDTHEAIDMSMLGNSEHRAIAQKAVAESLVLLKDTANILPISHNAQTIRIAGSSADNVGRQSGAWTVEWQGIDGNWLEGGTSILEGIKRRAVNDWNIEYSKEGVFATTSPKADIGIAIVGEAPYAEGWGDNERLELSAEDIIVIENLRQTSDKVLVIIVSGRPLIITDDIASWDALIAAWLPGSEGQGVADVLFGDKGFTGTLPLPWPRHIDQLPITTNGKTADGTQLLFPRYFGLR